MEGNLKKPDLSRYSIAEHLGFHEGALVICTKHQSAIASPTLMSAYIFCVDQETGIYKWVRRSEFTKKKTDTDHERDLAFTGMGGIVRAHMKDFDPTVRDAAFHVHNLLENYGDVTHMTYDSETVAVDSIVDRLKSADYLKAVGLLGIQPWATKPGELNTLFKTFVADTAEEELLKPDISPRASRSESDKGLRAITNRVESLININGDKDFTGFVEEFNILVTHYNTLANEHYGRLHARTDISTAIVDEIPAQPATGLPVHVIPVLRLRVTDRDGVEELIILDFSADFTVAYKNNVLPGTATLTAHGIGKYKGEIVTT
ncbi:MAG: DUF6261 family protein, partial [Tannerella sp.]|nr:DUF6261 family protein [Tannerella sp.]